MKFFIPHASSDAEGESVLRGIARFVGADVPPADKRIFKLAFSHNGKDFAVEVGKPVPAYFEEHDQEVIAILTRNVFFVCLPTRGVVRGEPIFVGASSVRRVEYFDAPPARTGV